MASIGKVFVKIAKGIEFVFSSLSYATSAVSSATGASMASNPMYTGAALAAGGILLFVAIYMLIKGTKRVLSGLTCVVLALVLFGGSVSLLLLAYAGGSVPVVLLSDSASLSNSSSSSSAACPCAM